MLPQIFNKTSIHPAIFQVAQIIFSIWLPKAWSSGKGARRTLIESEPAPTTVICGGAIPTAGNSDNISLLPVKWVPPASFGQGRGSEGLLLHLHLYYYYYSGALGSAGDPQCFHHTRIKIRKCISVECFPLNNCSSYLHQFASVFYMPTEMFWPIICETTGQIHHSSAQPPNYNTAAMIFLPAGALCKWPIPEE